MISQNGARVTTGWPLQVHRYEPDKLPDPADVLDCLLIVNDRSDGIPRARLVVSNGASFDPVAYLTDIPAGSPQVSTPALPPMQLPAVVPNVAAEVARQVARLIPASPTDTARLDAMESRLAECERLIDAFIQAAQHSKQIKDRY